MKKINNKGMSLIELIISFAIVTVAVVYFGQTLTTVSKLYKSAQEQTEDYVEEVYVYRMLEAMFEEYSKNSIQGSTGTKVMGIAGNKSIGFDTIFVYCDVEDNNLENINSIFNLASEHQKGSYNILGLNIKKLYPRNIKNGYIGERDSLLKDIFEGLGNLWDKIWGNKEETPSEEEGYDEEKDSLLDVKASEYMRQPSIINSTSTFEWIHVAGKKCGTFNESWINTDLMVNGTNFGKGDFWLPIEYYDSFGTVKRDFNKYAEWQVFKKNDGTHLGFTSINNYYNPVLRIFVSIAKFNGNTYKYYTNFNYNDYKNDGKEIKYFLTYQLGENDVINGTPNPDYDNTVRLKTYCTGGTDCNKTFDDEE